jgi:F-type H+-transporting ATPase subunit epsilon
MKHLTVKIVSPEKVVVSEDYISATVPSVTGQLTILPEHIPLVTKLKAGEIKLTTKESYDTLLSVSSGIIEVRPNSELIILADEAQRAEQIDLQKAEEARKRVEKLLEDRKNEQDIDYAKLQAILEKEIAKVKVARKYRKMKNIS